MAVFVHTGTGVSQTTVVNELAGSQVENGKEEAKRIVGAVLDATPIFGHVKGFVHDITGDHQAAERAYEAATRATAVLGAGAGGLLVGGPVTGAALSVTTGATWDVTTALATDGKETPGVASLVTNPGLETAVSAGISLAGDGLAGFVGAKVVGKLCEKIPKAGITKQLKAVVSEDIRPTESLGVEMIKTEIKNLKSTVISASEECKAAQDCYKYNKD
ncbi:uncharacterized protein LOC116919958 [Daphnia magna]|uniref:uncharacterized protein LOC116919958 n=1 Tax=Daphnia magna TaxID=35525 RepID=UPI0006E7CEF1|nr:uncharacterized protein LOC116919958 [Daphnia magna]